MFRDRNPVTTVKPEAAQRAFDKSEEAKDRRKMIADKEENWRTLKFYNDDKITYDGLNLREERAKASRADRESKEALTDVETPRKVTANRSRRSTGPKGGRN